MTEPQGALRTIAWREVFPWLLLADVFRLAKSLKMLLLGSLGVFLTSAGWWVLAWLFSGASEEEIPRSWLLAYRSCPWTETAWAQQAQPGAESGSPLAPGNGAPGSRTDASRGMQGPPAPERGAPLAPPQIDLELSTWDTLLLGEFSLAAAAAAPPRIGAYPITPTVDPWFNLMGPFRQMLAASGGYRSVTWVGFAFLLCCGLWVVSVWAWVGGAMTRLATVYLGPREKVQLRAALRFAGRKWWSYLGAPLLPLVGVLLASVPLLLAGLLMRSSLGLLLAALAWPVALLLGLFIAVLLLALLFGWPLMWPTISAENGDSFEALNRCYGYVYHRPLAYLGYALVATLLGTLGWAVVWGVAEGVVYLSNWCASWATGGQRMDDIQAAVAGTQSWGGAAGVGVWLLRVWEGLVRLVALGFVYSFFWSSASGIYLLLRLRVDGTELDAVFVEESQPPKPLPPLVPDQAGVPTVPDETRPAPAPAQEAPAAAQQTPEPVQQASTSVQQTPTSEQQTPTSVEQMPMSEQQTPTSEPQPPAAAQQAEAAAADPVRGSAQDVE